MKTQIAVLCIAAALSAASEGFAQQAGGAPESLRAVLDEVKPQETAGPALTLDEVERVAQEENPEIHAAVRRVALVQAHVATTGRLDDPQVMARLWQVPLKHPWDYNAAQNMLMYSQALPGPGKRALETSVAKSDADAAKDALETVRLRVRVEVRKAFFGLLLAQEELRIHDQHVAIARQAVEVARIKYTVGKVPQQDVLKAQLAMTRLAEHLIRFERDADVARARMNTLLGRDVATAIHVQGDFGVESKLPAVAELERLAIQSRPELMEALVGAEKSRKEQSLVKKAYVPDFSVAGGYMLMPSGSDMRNNYMLEGSMSIPWLNRRKHDAEIAEATAKVDMQDAETAALRNEVSGQVDEALAEAKAAQRLARMYHEQLEPQAEATLHDAVIAYENNQADLLNLLDSQMTVIDVNLAWFQSMGDFAASIADLEMAVGMPLDKAMEGVR